jgi:flavin-dependent dehydrogenase
MIDFRDSDYAMSKAALAGSSDVIVVGGGPAGCVCATSLANAGRHVMLATMPPAPRPRLPELLSPGAARALRSWISIGNLPDREAIPCRGVLSQWGRTGTRVTDYVLERCEPGWIVRRTALDRALFDGAAAAGVEIRKDWKCVRVAPNAQITVTFDTASGPHESRAACVVLATGRTPAMRARMAYHDQQVAFAAAVEDGVALHDLLWLESVDQGWWYVMPTPRGGAQVVFVTQARPSGTAFRDRRRFFADAFARATLIRAAFTRQPAFDAVAIFDARLTHPIDSLPDNVIRIGDAAGSSDPLSGQGWVRAAQSALAAAVAIDEYLRTGEFQSIRAFNRGMTANFEQCQLERASHWARSGIGTTRYGNGSDPAPFE